MGFDDFTSNSDQELHVRFLASASKCSGSIRSVGTQTLRCTRCWHCSVEALTERSTASLVHQCLRLSTAFVSACDTIHQSLFQSRSTERIPFPALYRGWFGFLRASIAMPPSANASTLTICDANSSTHHQFRKLRFSTNFDIHRKFYILASNRSSLP